MTEIPKGHIFFDLSKDFFLVEIDNQGNSILPVGNPPIIRNYVNEISIANRLCFQEQFNPVQGFNNYVLIDKNGTYLSHVSIKFNAIFSELFGNDKLTIKQFPYSNYPTHIISNICSLRFPKRGLCNIMMNIIVNHIFNNKNNIPFSLKSSTGYAQKCVEKVGFEYLYFDYRKNEINYFYYPTNIFNLSTLQKLTPFISNIKFDKLVFIAHGAIDNRYVLEEKPRYFPFKNINFLVEKGCLLVPSTWSVLEGDRICKDLIKVKEIISPINEQIKIFNMMFTGHKEKTSKYQSFIYGAIGLYACDSKNNISRRIFDNDYLKNEILDFEKFVDMCINICNINKINPADVKITVVCCRQYTVDEMQQIQKPSPVSVSGNIKRDIQEDIQQDIQEDIIMKDVLSDMQEDIEGDIIMKGGINNIGKEELKKMFDGVNIEELKKWLLEEQYICPREKPLNNIRKTPIKPASRKPSSRKPSSRKPSSRKPSSRKPTSRKPSSRKPTSRKPASNKISTKRNTTKRNTTKTNSN